ACRGARGYWEAGVEELPEGAAARVGWGRRYANLQAPLGYDKFGYSWRSRKGTRLVLGGGRGGAARGRGGARGLGPALRQPAGAAGIRQVRLLYWEAGVEELPEGAAARVGWGRRYANLQAPLGYDKFGYSWRSRKGTRLVLGGGRGGAARGRGGARGLGPALRQPAGAAGIRQVRLLYWEAGVEELPEGAAARVGWGRRYANLQAPLGYDKFGYSWRSRKGTRLVLGGGRGGAARGRGGARGLGPALRQPAGAAGIRQVRLLYWEAGVEELPEGAAARVGWGRRYANLQAPLGYDKFGYSWRSRKGTRLVLGGGRGGAARGRGGARGLGPALRQPAGAAGIRQVRLLYWEAGVEELPEGAAARVGWGRRYANLQAPLGYDKFGYSWRSRKGTRLVLGGGRGGAARGRGGARGLGPALRQPAGAAGIRQVRLLYWEAGVEELPEGAAARVGWGRRYANLQAPLGYDKFGYSWRSRKGTRLVLGGGRGGAARGRGGARGLGPALRQPAGAAGIRQVRLLYWEAGVEELPEGAAARVGWGRRYANLQAPLGYDKFGYSWRSRKGTRLVLGGGRGGAARGRGGARGLGPALRQPAGAAGIRQVRLLYWEAGVEELPEGAAARVGWGRRYANLQAPLGYDKFGYSWRSRKGTRFHESRGKHYSSGYGEGDTLGFLIVLPDSASTKYTPNTYKDRPLVKFKSHLYYEDKDNIQESLNSLKPLPGSKILFFKNGECQGEAFIDVYRGCYYPSVSLHKNITVSVNFGPNFKFPPSTDYNYKPMSEKAEEAICEQTMADLLYLTENEGKLRLDNFNL
ncbi:hypothetical protein ACJJTC_016558, partial [Scirpophaga incertulas]